MEDETWTYDLSNASRISGLKSHLELFIDFDDVDEDDELKTAYPCPFCPEDFDLLELCWHIDEEHSIEANSGICPVCTTRVATRMVRHITAQHGNIFKSQHKLRCRKLESYPTLSYSTKDLDDGQWHSSTAGSSHLLPTSKTSRDPFVSFIYSAPAAVEHENVQPDSSSELTMEEICSDETSLERDVQPSICSKDQMEKAQRSKFVQGLLMSTILDPDSD